MDPLAWAILLVRASLENCNIFFTKGTVFAFVVTLEKPESLSAKSWRATPSRTSKVTEIQKRRRRKFWSTFSRKATLTSGLVTFWCVTNLDGFTSRIDLVIHSGKKECCYYEGGGGGWEGRGTLGIWTWKSVSIDNVIWAALYMSPVSQYFILK